MWADTEIRRDLIRSWRDEAVALWRELFREPPELDPEDDPEDESWRYWWMAREETQVEIAISAMDVGLAREIDDACWRSLAEVRILDRRGDVNGIAEILERACSIDDPLLRGKTLSGICLGVKTPATARDLGLLGHAISIPASCEEQQEAIFHLVSMLNERQLWRWVNPPRAGHQWLMYAEASGDRQAARYALEIALFDSNRQMIRRTMQMIARTGDLELNEWAFRRMFGHMKDEERGVCFALLGRGPLGKWATEFAHSTARSMLRLDESFASNVLSRVFGDWRFCGYARDNVLAELAVVRRDPSLTEEMEAPRIPELTCARIAIETGDPGPIRALENYRDRASGLAALGYRSHDERLLLEACQQFDGEEKDRKYLYCLGSLIDVASNPPVRPLPDQIPIETWPAPGLQLSLPIEN